MTLFIVGLVVGSLVTLYLSHAKVRRTVNAFIRETFDREGRRKKIH